MNESARTLSWLSELFDLNQPTFPSPAEKLWGEIALQMSQRQQTIVYLQDWISDYWLARGTRSNAAALAPRWDPAYFLDDWRSGGRSMAGAIDLPSRSTNHDAFLALLKENHAPKDPYDAQALTQFLQWKEQIQKPRGDRTIQVEIVRAWLGTSIGHLLMSVLLTPPDPSLIEATVGRLRLPTQFELPSAWVNDFEERRIEILYNWRYSPDGQLLQSPIRVGQGEEWREHWGWLSAGLDAPRVLEAVQLAAQLMRHPVLPNVLNACIHLKDGYLRTVSLCILRRWLLALKAMAWLETALVNPWQWVQPQDLSCFAFNALKPDWPRRSLAISHRSGDVKPALIEMGLWGSGRCAIDANYVPSWETNMGMMWGLFSTPGLIARVDSPHYNDSVWCRREREIVDFLLHDADFLSDRAVIDVPQANLAQLDRVLSFWQQDNGDIDTEVTAIQSFPPNCMVWSILPTPDWQVKLYRAAAALRIMNVFLSDPGLTNSLADMIYGGLEVPGPAPTNNPHGWKAYSEIFRDLMPFAAADKLPLHLPSTYSTEDRARDEALSVRIPDLSSGEYDLRDVLVALEWLCSEWPVMVEQKRGDFLLINCQQLSRTQWTTAIELSLHRGLTGMRAPVPLWFLQTAGQDVETWPLVGDRPIFTEHVREQLRWMVDISVDPAAWQAAYPSDSGLDFAPELAQLCKTGGQTLGGP